jgi:hypothetical protein
MHRQAALHRVRDTSYFEIRKLARFCAIDVNTLLSSLACCTS